MSSTRRTCSCAARRAGWRAGHARAPDSRRHSRAAARNSRAARSPALLERSRHGHCLLRARLVQVGISPAHKPRLVPVRLAVPHKYQMPDHRGLPEELPERRGHCHQARRRGEARGQDEQAQ
eukprot:5416666-Prymnesium_polylepis.1